ncbi:MAG: ABC transporter substrate-binding protein [Myxococcota bacterium]
MRHRAKPSSVIALLLVVGAACTSSQSSKSDALVVVIPRDAEQLDPRFVGDPYGLRISRLLFGSLVTIDPRTLEVVPDLAESVQALSPTSYEVVLKPGLRFSDGSPLEAEDVAETFRGVADPELQSRYARTYRRISEIEVIDPRTLRFTLREPHATFLTDLELPIVPRADARRRVATEEDPYPVGAGPYRLTKRSPGVLELAPNAYWHRGIPKTPALRFVVIRDDNTRALRMLAGQGDLAIGAIPPLLLPMFEERDDFQTKRASGVSTMYLGFHTESPPLRDVRVRQAVAAAIDRERLVEAKYDGMANVTESWVPLGHWAHADALPNHDYNPDEARRLLDEAGFENPPGDKPRMRLILRTTSDRSRQSIARAIAAMLRDVGIEVDVRPSEAATLISDLNKGRFDLTLLQVPEVIEPHVLSWFFESSRVPGEGGEGANRWRYRNPALDALFERGRTESEPEVRREIYAEAQQILARDLPVLPLWQPDTVAVAKDGVDVDVPRDGRFGTLAF